MDLQKRVALFRQLDPDQLSEAELRHAFPPLLALCEESLTAIAALQAEVQQLKDEVARLKGQKGKPTFPRTKGQPGAGIIAPLGEGPGSTRSGHSSETERQEGTRRKPWKKSTKLDRIQIDRERTCAWLGPLPADAQPKGYVPVVVQDLVIHTDNVRFYREKYYSPSTGRTYLGPLPPGYTGQFGPGVRTLSLALVYGCHLSQPLLHAFLEDTGLQISRGQVCRLVTEGLETFHAEQRAVFRAGLESSPWQHLDLTSTRVDGENWACHVLGNPLFSHFHTLPHQDRHSALDVLRGGAPRQYRLDRTAWAYLQAHRLPAHLLAGLQAFPQEITWSEAEFHRLLAQRLPLLGSEPRKEILAAAALAAYRADPTWPVLQCLLTDDAAQLRELTPELALCWVHDGRHYQKLRPQFACHQRELERFRQQYWSFYRELRAYRAAPSPAEAVRLEAAFDTLCATQSLWTDLRTCIERTRTNKEKLLLVLRHPELPLHNNPAELMARRRVRKRDVSFGPRSPAGLRAWDTFQGLVETTRKLGLSFWEYLRDRLHHTGAIPPLAEVLAEQAAPLQLGASWIAA